MPIVAYGTPNASTPLGPMQIERRAQGPRDVTIDILYCGVCHTDLHFARNDWGFTAFPAVPGHEIVGRVTSVGDAASKFKVGDLAAVGCMLDSCRHCSSCAQGEEQYCENGNTQTYGGIEKQSGKPTNGGYSKAIVVDEDFVFRVPPQLDPAGVAPLLCAGITTYSPLRHWKVGKDSKVGVIGLGGLGHVAVKLAHAMGAHVVLFTTSPGKIADGKRLGADEVVLSSDADAMAQCARSLDIVLNTVSAPLDLDLYVSLLKRDGTLVLLGAPSQPNRLPSVFGLLMKRAGLAGSLIGGIRETQEMLDFCAEHGIVSDIEMIPIQQVNEAFVRMEKGDVKYRFVIDMKSLGAG